MIPDSNGYEKVGILIKYVPNIRIIFDIDEYLEQYFYIMKKKTYAERILKSVAQKKILRSNDLKEMHIPRIVLTRLVQSGQLEKIDSGLYCLPKMHITEHTNLATIATKIPQAVFCLLTALQLHELTTQLPRKVWIAMPRGSHTPKWDYPPLKMVQCSPSVYSEGVETIKYNKQIIRIYSPAKTIVDCFKHRNKIGLDVAIEALREARTQKKVSADDLWHFAKICRVTNIIRPYLEAIE